MKILIVNKFYYLRGGAEQYVLTMEAKLKEEGHEVAIFSMHHPKNLSTPWSKYFVSRVSFNEGNLWNRLKGAGRTIYSFEARRKFKKIIKDFKPDVIHYHNIYHQLSPSILSVARKYNIPSVMHLHDYKLISANYSLFSRGKINYNGVAPRYYRCFLDKSFQNSYAKSLIVTLEMYLHHTILKSYEKNINLYLTPSNFMKDICVTFGVPEKKITALYSFTPFKLTPSTESLSNFILYFGRLSEEKGVDVLLEAIAASDNKPTLKIIGRGPKETELKELANSLKLDHVEFLGHLEAEDLRLTIERAVAIVIPSIWLENMPSTLLEALTLGKVVIASKIGGLDELIKDQVNGLLFPLGDSQALAAILDNLSKININLISLEAKKSVETFTIDRHYKELMTIYKDIKVK
ncbi:MAG TPA: glycosyltransferase [bacterium]|nr:glycosyltransferase [bacterium]